MNVTPVLPDSIRHAHVYGDVTAHSLLPDERRPYGTESLYGDWAGRVLLLAKDFAPSEYLRTRLAAEDRDPYRHDPDRRTNKRLDSLTKGLRGSPDAKSCRMLYGSALANLLRDDSKWSGTLPNRGAATNYGSRVVDFTLGHMPRLEANVCMGREAWEATAEALGLGEPWEAVRGGGRLVRHGVLTVAVVPHPAARLSNAEHQRAWDRVIGTVRA